jgi:hypothetical protein
MAIAARFRISCSTKLSYGVDKRFHDPSSGSIPADFSLTNDQSILHREREPGRIDDEFISLAADLRIGCVLVQTLQ